MEVHPLSDSNMLSNLMTLSFYDFSYQREALHCNLVNNIQESWNISIFYKEEKVLPDKIRID